MSDTIHVATRKGLFTVERKGRGVEGWRIVRGAFLGDPVTMVFHDRRDGTLYAALNLGHFGVKLHRSEDGGSEWEECAVPSYAGEAAPAAGAQRGGAGAEESGVAAEGGVGADEGAGAAEGRAVAEEGGGAAQGGDEGAAPGKKFPSLTQIWALEAGGDEGDGLLWCGTIPGGLFASNDRGSSWRINRSLWDRPERASWFGGGYDEPGIHSIAVDPRDAKHVTVGVSCGGVWVTRDGGETWACSTKGMYAAYMPPEKRETPEIQDPHRLVLCRSFPEVMWVQHHNGVFRSTDAAASWTEIASIRPSNFGFAVAVHPSEPATAWFVPGLKDECRIPVDGDVVVARTRDGGETFELLREGLPQGHAYDLVYRHGLDVDESGDLLAMGSTTGGLWITEDQGDHWHLVSAHLPPIYTVRFA